MRMLHKIVALTRSLFRSRRIDTDLAEEMRFHVEREIVANIDAGMSPRAARRAAQMKFGGVDRMHETARDERPGAVMRELVRDLRHGVRLLRKTPVFGVTSITIVALAIGAATAIF